MAEIFPSVMVISAVDVSVVVGLKVTSKEHVPQETRMPAQLLSDT